MPNLTVSSAVDTFMQASDQAGMQAALGSVGAIQLPQWTYESGGGDPSGIGKFTQSAGTLKMSQFSIGNYDASILLQNLQLARVIVFTFGDGGVSAYQTAADKPALSDGIYTFSNGSTYGDAFDVGTYSVSFATGEGIMSNNGGNAALPSSDPNVAGALWNNMGVVNVSNG